MWKCFSKVCSSGQCHATSLLCGLQVRFISAICELFSVIWCIMCTVIYQTVVKLRGKVHLKVMISPACHHNLGFFMGCNGVMLTDFHIHFVMRNGGQLESRHIPLNSLYICLCWSQFVDLSVPTLFLS